ncbi:MAG: CDP-alcohol phosphatidyltransferase family protein [Acidobacteriota bacterium]
MSKTVRLAIAGIGNCASSLLQGIDYYRNRAGEEMAGLLHQQIGGYEVGDIQPVAAFDVDPRKVGKPLREAVFAPPNCTTVFQHELTDHGVTVQMSPVLDGVAEHMKNRPEEKAFRIADAQPCDVVQVLRETGADVLVSYLPVGSEMATRHHAQACLDAGVAMVNCIPAFIASHPEWSVEFRKHGLPIVGDDIKSQLGATVVHRTLARLMGDRGVRLQRTYQLNTGGNTDFLNMLEQERLRSKRISKTESVQSQLPAPLSADNIHIGPSDYVAWQRDNPISRRLSAWLSSTGITPDQITVATLALALAGAVLLAIGNVATSVAGGLVVQASSILDGCDGEIARLTHRETARGAWLDTIFDRYADSAVVLAVTLAAARTWGGPWVWIGGMMALAGFILASYTTKEYAIRHASAYPSDVLDRLKRRDLRLLGICVGAVVGHPYAALLVLGLLSHACVLGILRRGWKLSARHAP